eukprot:1254032-Rhodomonas_salina.1
MSRRCVLHGRGTPPHSLPSTSGVCYAQCAACRLCMYSGLHPWPFCGRLLRRVPPALLVR